MSFVSIKCLKTSHTIKMGFTYYSPSIMGQSVMLKSTAVLTRYFLHSDTFIVRFGLFDA